MNGSVWFALRRLVGYCRMLGRLAVLGALMSIGLASAQVQGTEGPALEQKPAAMLRGMDKVTGFSKDTLIRVGDAILVGSLEVTLRACFQTAPEETPESAAFLEVRETRPSATERQTAGEDKPLIFSGWMFASSPGLNALEHPVYDVWLITCSASAP